jgi:hypothetical protein
MHVLNSLGNFWNSWFQNVILANRACDGGIAAWQGTSGTKNGAYIADSQIIRVSFFIPVVGFNYIHLHSSPRMQMPPP